MDDVKEKRLNGASDSAVLIVGSIINGAAAYAYIALGTRSFGADGFAPVSILWTIWALTVAVVTFPLQHWTIRTIVWHDESRLRSEIGRIALVVAGFAAVVFFVTFVGRAPLFGSDGIGMAVLAGLVVLEAGILGLVRGVVSGRGQFKQAAVIVGGENVLRLVAGIAVVVAGWSVYAYGAGLLFGVLIVLLFPSSLRFRATIGGSSGPSSIGELGGIAGGTLVAQLILTGQPIAAALLGAGSTTVTAIFATTAVFRAPYLVALGLALRSMHQLTEFAKTERDRLRRATISIGLGGALVAIVAGGVGGLVGPAIVSAVFGAGSSLSSWATGVIVFGSTMALVSLGLTLILIALASTRSISFAWLVAAGVGMIPILVVADPVTGIVTGFGAAETVAVALLTVLASRVARRSNT